MEIGKIQGDISEHRLCETANGLTDDLLVEILSRLPVKSLYRFACASKAWNAIITNNDYYRKKLPSPVSGLFYMTTFESGHNSEYVSTQVNRQDDSVGLDISSTVLSFLPPYHRLHVVGCCNGLILCYSWETVSESDNCLYVCNPATKKYNKIPKPDRHSVLALAFDPHLSPHYKAVTISFWSTGEINYMEILSSETNEWVKYKDCKGLDRPFCICAGFSVFLRGNIHFLDTGGSFVVVVDVEKKVCREMEIPHNLKGVEVIRGCLGQFKGSLRCALETRNKIIVWDLVDYDRNQWSLRYRVGLDGFIESPVDPWWDVRIMALHPYSDIIFIVLHDKLLVYNFRASNITEMYTLRGTEPAFFYTYSPCDSEGIDQ